MTSAEFKTAFPTFKSERDEDIERHMATAGLYFTGTGTGAAYVLGLFTAHFIASEKRAMATDSTWNANDVVSQSIQDATGRASSIQRGESLLEAQQDDQFKSTRWGQMAIQAAAALSPGGGARVISSTSRGFSTRGTTYTKGPFQTD